MKQFSITFTFILTRGITANICIATITVTNACHDVGSLDARQTDANTLAFSDNDLEELKI